MKTKIVDITLDNPVIDGNRMFLNLLDPDKWNELKRRMEDPDNEDAEDVLVSKVMEEI